MFADGTVDRRVARMQADSHPALAFPFFHGGDDRFQGHAGTVEDTAVFFRTGQQLRVDQRASVNDLIRCFQQFLAADGNEVDSTGTGADKMYHRSSPFVCNARNAWARDDCPKTP